MMNLEFETDNAAFTGTAGPAEAARILRDIAERVEAGDESGEVHDANGNNVGRWYVEYPEPEGEREVTCPECEWEGPQHECDYCEGIDEPHNPAGEILEGQCPECGAYVLSEPRDN